MIKIEFTCDTVKDAQAEMAALLAGNGEGIEFFQKPIALIVPDNKSEQVKGYIDPDTLPKTAPKKKAEKVVIPADTVPAPMPGSTGDPVSITPEVKTGDPVTTPATSGPVDPFAVPAPIKDAATAPQPPATPYVKPEKLTIQDIQHCVARNNSPTKRADTRNVLTKYKNKDGAEVMVPSDVQEKDFEAVYSDLEALIK